MLSTRGRSNTLTGMWDRRLYMDSSGTKKPGDITQRAFGKRKLFSRDLNYLRDLALFWPFVIYLIFAVASAFSPPHRGLALRCATVAVTALLLARERLVLFIMGTGFIAILCAINLLLHPWRWGVFTAGILAASPFIVVTRYWRRTKLSYDLPADLRLVDALWSIASICGSLLLGYIISPFN